MKRILNRRAQLLLRIGLLGTIAFVALVACGQSPKTPELSWVLKSSDHSVRHEAGLLSHEGELILLGGRGERAIEHYDPASNTWDAKLTPELELHHFQPVSLNGKVYILGALTGGWPTEQALENVVVYDAQANTLSATHPIPSARRRGAAGVVEYGGDLYMLGGLTNGHMSGSVPWFDRYNPKTGQWTQLADAPLARDHFQAVVVNHKLYAIAGRQTSHATGEGMSLTQAQVDVYDFVTQSWSTLSQDANLNVPRAGNMAIAFGDHIIVGGGESSAQEPAHNEISIFDTAKQSWLEGPALNAGRHGTGFGIINEQLYTVSGSGKAGGEPELANLEVIDANALAEKLGLSMQASTVHERVVPFGEHIGTDIFGEEASELAQLNPFTHYLMQVDFIHENGDAITVQGYFAGDGNAANSSADSGQVWRTKFTPQVQGKWSYSAKLYKGDDVVLATVDELEQAEVISERNGQFLVGEPVPNASFFARHGQIQLKDGYFYFPHSDTFWIKAGTNSPENFLSFHEVDGTYRASQQAREGEAKAPDFIHEFEAHVQDWQEGDALWQAKNGTDKGKGIIGASNYLADMGMQAQYFLTMNINGDGRDVWPYISHEEFERFDISKLAQWDIIFSHLQKRGVLLHVVTQETENELLLDGGNTKRLRALYYRELIARFGYHNGLIWNLGEENGPSDWSPQGQSSEQRYAMAAYFAENDPHNNPIFLHTMPSANDKDNLLPPLYASAIEGMSFQVDDRSSVFEQISKWRRLSKENGSNDGQGWAITMDEIGMWHTGAKVDADDPTHDSLRRHALWGALLAGATGIEWYFGAHQPHNDLSSEDFRVRKNLWKQTHIAAEFFNELDDEQIRLSSLQAVEKADAVGLYQANIGPMTIVYGLDTQDSFALKLEAGEYKVVWLNPISAERSAPSKVSVIELESTQLTKPDAMKGKDAVLSVTTL